MKPLSEIPVLDNLRALAAWSVCLYHFVCTTTGFINQESLLYRSFYFGQYGVHLFFIISGMVIPWSLYKNSYHIKNILRFVVKRLIRLEPPYLFSVLLAIGIIYFRKYSPTYDGVSTHIGAKQILLHLGYMVPFFKDVTWLNNVYWTLAIEFQYYLVIGILYFLFISPQLIVRCIGYLVLLGAPFLPFSSDFLPFWLPLFGVGIVLFLFKSGQVGFVELLVALSCFIIHLFFYNSLIAASIAVVAVFVILFMFSFTNPLLSFLGKFSYSVYLIHPLLGATFVNVASHYVTGGSAKFLLVLAGLLITAAGSYLMYLCIERPSKKWSSKLKYKS